MSTPDLSAVKASIPAKVRQTIYVAYVLLVVANGAAAAGYAAVGTPQPSALVVIAAVLLYLGVPVGTLAAVNVVKTEAVVDLSGDR